MRLPNHMVVVARALEPQVKLQWSDELVSHVWETHASEEYVQVSTVPMVVAIFLAIRWRAVNVSCSYPTGWPRSFCSQAAHQPLNAGENSPPVREEASVGGRGQPGANLASLTCCLQSDVDFCIAVTTEPTMSTSTPTCLCVLLRVSHCKMTVDSPVVSCCQS
jgi:hypothetical protein